MKAEAPSTYPNLSGMVGMEVEVGPERGVKEDIQNVKSSVYCWVYISIFYYICYIIYKCIFIILQYLQNKNVVILAP